MTNWAGITASLSALVRPSILEPRLVVSSISQLDFQKLKQRGVVGVVIDKDNCITVPHRDQLAPVLKGSWQDLLDTFGPSNVLIVSNSVGTLAKDPALLGAEAVSRNLRVPVLAHSQPKPGRKCVGQIALHFDQLAFPPPFPPSTSQIVYSPLAQHHNRLSRPLQNLSETEAETGGGDSLKILVIGDRLATDLILSHRLSQLSLPLPGSSTPAHASLFSRIFRRPSSRNSEDDSQPPEKRRKRTRRIETVGILTTSLHEKEGLGTMFLRGLEKLALKRLQKKRTRWEGQEWEECIKGYTTSPPLVGKPSTTVSSVALAHATRPALEQERPSSSSSSSSTSRFAPKFISTLSSFLILPTILPHFSRRLPALLLSSLRNIPSKLSRFVSRAGKKSFDYGLERLPVFLGTTLYRPMEKLVRIYTPPPPPPSQSTTTTTTWTTTMKPLERGIDRTLEGTGEGGVLDRVLDRVERVVELAREKIAVQQQQQRQQKRG